MNRLLKNVFIVVFIFNGLIYAHVLKLTTEEENYIKNNEVTVALLKNIYPFSYKNRNKTEGFTPELLALISEKSHLKFKFITDTWPNHFDNFTQRKIDIISEISYTKERASYIKFTKPYFEIPLAIYSHKDFAEYDNTLKSLQGKKLGITREVYYAKEIEDTHLFYITYFDSLTKKMQALESKEVDLVIGNLLSSQKIIQEKKLNNIKTLDEFKTKNLKKEDLRFGIHKDNPILYSIINKTFNSLSQKELLIIKDKWLGNYPKSVNTIYEGTIKLSKNEQNYLKNKQIIKMCNNPHFAPIEFLDKNNKISGISIDTIRLIEQKLNRAITIQHVKTSSIKESHEFFENKTCDILSLSIPSLYNSKYTYTKPYLYYKPVLITRDTEPFINSFEDIKFKGVAIKNNPLLIKILEKKYLGINITETQSNRESFEKVSAGKVYSTISILPVASYNITKYGLSNLKIAGHENKNIEFSIALNNDKNNHLLSILNKSLRTITQKEKSEIFNKWANIKYDKKTNYSKLINLATIAILVILFLVYRQLILSKNNEKLQKAKDKLEESNNHFKAILEATVEAIFISNKDGVLIECNQMACKLFGYTKQELLGMDKYKLFSKDFHKVVKRKIENRNTESYEIVAKNKKGESIPVLVRGSSIVKDNAPHRVSIALDLSQLKKTQAALENLNKELAIKVINEVKKNKNKDLKLLQQARHAQMGELISMIAHQWRQPLNAIAATVMNLQLQMSLDKFDFTQKKERNDFFNFINIKLENIEEFTQTLSLTIDDFRNFYKPNNLSKVTSINVPIRKALAITKALILSKKIELKLHLNSQKDIEIYENELLQVFLNLIKNAQDNFEDRNIINPTITINSIDTKKGVRVEVLDNGGGINSEIINNIFDPYFSTKDIKNGTGLGLYMSKTITEEHHKGKLYVQNLKDGVCFSIELNNSLK